MTAVVVATSRPSILSRAHTSGHSASMPLSGCGMLFTCDSARLTSSSSRISAVLVASLRTVASLTVRSDLDRPMDLTGAGLGQHTWASAIALLVTNHPGTETGEFAVLRGIQGARGYLMWAEA